VGCGQFDVRAESELDSTGGTKPLKREAELLKREGGKLLKREGFPTAHIVTVRMAGVTITGGQSWGYLMTFMRHSGDRRRFVCSPNTWPDSAKRIRLG